MRHALFDRIPLTAKMVALTILVGGAAWLVLDALQSESLRGVLNARVERQLADQAGYDRERFDVLVQSQGKTVKLLASQGALREYVEREARAGWPGSMGGIREYQGVPPWLPSTSVLRAFVRVRYALVIDLGGRTREVFRSGPSLPALFGESSELLRLVSHNQVFMTTVEGVPYALASAEVTDTRGAPLATLLLATPIDDEFFAAWDAARGLDHVVALVSRETGTVLASSDPGRVPSGTPMADLAERFLTSGKSFFDYGASDLLMSLVSFVSTEEADRLTADILRTDRTHRLLMGLTLLGAFGLVIYWISRTIDGLTRRIVSQSEALFGVEGKIFPGGDQLVMLGERFDAFSEEIVASREALRREYDERVRTEVASREREREVAFLRTVTGALGVGVLGWNGRTYAPANPLMEDFLSCCGTVADFIPSDGETDERAVIDGNGKSRIFRVRRSEMAGDLKFLLVQEITQQRRAEEQVRKLSQAVEQSSSMIMITNVEGIVEYVNPRFREVTGYSPEEMVGRNAKDLPTGESSSREYCNLWETLGAGGEWRGEIENVRKSGECYWEWNSVSPIRDSHGRVTHYLAIKEDVTERKGMEERLKALSVTDELTGLLNRRGFLDRAEAHFLVSRRSGVRMHLLYADLDDLKTINDTLGHRIGDEAIGEAALVLRNTFRETDILGRVGGDEFAVVMVEAADSDVARAGMERLTSAISEANGRPDRLFGLSLSVGLASADPGDLRSIDELIARADELMYNAKKLKKGPDSR